jgi:hypothetical protein
MCGERLVMAGVLDTRFRSALVWLAQGNRLLTCTREIDPDLEAASIMKAMDGGAALLFPSVKGHDVPDPLGDQHLALAAEAAAVLFLGSRCLDHRAHPRFAPLVRQQRARSAGAEFQSLGKTNSTDAASANSIVNPMKVRRFPNRCSSPPAMPCPYFWLLSGISPA